MATSNAIPLSDDERSLVVRALGMLSASLRRSSKSAPSREIAELFDRDAGRVDGLASKFR